MIVVVGSLNSDLVVASSRIPRPGETILGNSFHVYSGGKGGNQAVAIARLDHPCSMIGKLGRDSFGRDLRAQLQASGVLTEAVAETDGPSGVAIITTDSAGENSIIVVPGANGLLSPADIDANRDLIQAADMVLTQLEIPMDTVLHLARVAAEARVPLMLDPAPAAPLADELQRLTAWLTPNQTEAMSLLGETSAGTYDTAQARAEALLARGPKGVILKMGGHGAYIATADGLRAHVPAFSFAVVDTTAAGDAFNAGFAVGLAQGMPPVEAARFASAVAGISVTRQGAQPSLPTLSETRSFLQSHPTR
jgi:ribokinase